MSVVSWWVQLEYGLNIAKIQIIEPYAKKENTISHIHIYWPVLVQESNTAHFKDLFKESHRNNYEISQFEINHLIPKSSQLIPVSRYNLIAWQTSVSIAIKISYCLHENNCLVDSGSSHFCFLNNPLHRR